MYSRSGADSCFGLRLCHGDILRTMFREALERAWVSSAKHVFAAREDIYWEDFIRPKQRDITVSAEPFPHIIVDDFFKPHIYTGLVEEFRAAQEKGYSKDESAFGTFHAFEIDYDGYVYSPSATLEPTVARSIFWSLEWNSFFSGLFGQHTTFETSVAFHHHPPGDRTGFVHHDYANKRFPDGVFLSNGVVPYTIAEDAPMGYVKRRAIAFLYFLENDGWQERDGGETGLYAKDKQTLIKKVAPINNRLLAFHISPHSYHAFQGNRHDRNAIVQWLHAPVPQTPPHA